LPGALDPVVMPARHDEFTPEGIRQGLDESRKGERAINGVGRHDAHETDRLF
jgi:hypothetical protein